MQSRHYYSADIYIFFVLGVIVGLLLRIFVITRTPSDREAASAPKSDTGKIHYVPKGKAS